MGDKSTFSQALRNAIRGAWGGILGSIFFFVLVLVVALVGGETDRREALLFAAAMAGFIEAYWPSTSKIRVGNYGAWGYRMYKRG